MPEQESPMSAGPRRCAVSQAKRLGMLLHNKRNLHVIKCRLYDASALLFATSPFLGCLPIMPG